MAAGQISWHLSAAIVHAAIPRLRVGTRTSAAARVRLGDVYGRRYSTASQTAPQDQVGDAIMLLGLINDLLQRRQNLYHTVSLCEWVHCLPDHRSRHSAAIGTPHCESD